jgi:hypothetical protein
MSHLDIASGRPTPPGIAVFIFVPIALGISGWAQTARGNVSGYVEDTSRARVPNANITLIHSATGQSRTVRSNERGEFLAASLPIGAYEIAAEVPGFKRLSFSGILLRVDQTLELPIVVEPGSVSETIEVTGGAPLLEPETSSLGQVIENKKVLDMPLNGRNVFALGLLSGLSTEVTGVATNQTFAAGGGRFSGNEIELDGVADTTIINAGSIGRIGVLYTPSVDAVEEFKVKTNAFSAEFGHATGAVVSATTKAGSNTPHGTLFEFLRNDDLDANNFFANAAGGSKPPFRQNQFGGALGGPFFLPKLYDGHNRTFFFLDYQGTRQRSTLSSAIYDFPSLGLRAGDFSGLSQRIYDPNTRQVGPAGTVIADPFPNNRIPASDINPTSTAVESAIPAPNFGLPGANSRDFFSQPHQRINGDQFDIRVDQKLAESNSLFGRFSFGNTVNTNTGIFLGPLSTGSTQLEFARHAVLNDVHLISPHTINEFRFGFARSNGSIIGVGQSSASFGRQAGMALFPFPVQGVPAITSAIPVRLWGKQSILASEVVLATSTSRIFLNGPIMSR